MNFSLNPPSGHSHSCLDVQFDFSAEKLDKVELEIFNDTIQEQLELLSVSDGYILGETKGISTSSQVTGHINIFNKDKMNEKFQDYISVQIRCKATITRDGAKDIEESSIEFFNESKSIDAEVIPFDLIIDNPQLDVKNNIPLSMHMVCDSARKFELSIRSDDGKDYCTFEVMSKKGRADFILPSEVIFSDTNFYLNWHKKFRIYWVKFEGIDYLKFMNRKYIRLPESQITLNSKEIMPLPQERQGPLGVLSEDFVLSHRYFVHTWKDFSEFGDVPQMTQLDIQKRRRFVHEIQDLPVPGLGSTQPVKSNIAAGKEILQTEKLRKPEYDPRQRVLLNAYRNAFDKNRAATKSDERYTQTTLQTKQTKPVVAPMGNQPRKGGCGCARKRNA